MIRRLRNQGVITSTWDSRPHSFYHHMRITKLLPKQLTPEPLHDSHEPCQQNGSYQTLNTHNIINWIFRALFLLFLKIQMLLWICLTSKRVPSHFCLPVHSWYICLVGTKYLQNLNSKTIVQKGTTQGN